MKAEEHPLSQLSMREWVHQLENRVVVYGKDDLSEFIRKAMVRLPLLLKAEQERDEYKKALESDIEAMDAATAKISELEEENQKLKLDSMEESKRLIDENFDLKSAVLKGLAEEGRLKAEITRLKAEVWDAGKNVGINYYLHEGRGQDNELL